MKNQKTMKEIDLQQEKEFNEYWLDIFSVRARGKSYKELEKEIKELEEETKELEEEAKATNKKTQKWEKKAIKNLLQEEGFSAQKIAKIFSVSVKQVREIQKEIEQ